jgi:hypothetical protein
MPLRNSGNMQISDGHRSIPLARSFADAQIPLPSGGAYRASGMSLPRRETWISGIARRFAKSYFEACLTISNNGVNPNILKIRPNPRKLEIV